MLYVYLQNLKELFYSKAHTIQKIHSFHVSHQKYKNNFIFPEGELHTYYN